MTHYSYILDSIKETTRNSKSMQWNSTKDNNGAIKIEAYESITEGRSTEMRNVNRCKWVDSYMLTNHVLEDYFWLLNLDQNNSGSQTARNIGSKEAYRFLGLSIQWHLVSSKYYYWF